MLQCFDAAGDGRRLDRDPFVCAHRLLGHPSLSLDNLSEVILSLPRDHVKHSSGKVGNGADFENAYVQHRNGLSLEQTVERIRESDSYIMVRSPERHPSLQGIHRDLLADVETLMARSGLPGRALMPRLYLFIASPNGHTPFHIDRNSTLLLQLRGSKQVTVFPTWDERVVRPADCEAYMAYANTRLPWRAEIDDHGQRFDFSPGQALHIPFGAGHHVHNGPDDVSVSLSIIFNTPESMAWLNALQFNHWVRPKLSGLGLVPAGVGQSRWRDAGKSTLWRAMQRAARTARSLRAPAAA